MNLNDILTATNGKISTGLSFNVKMMHEINYTHMIRSIYVYMVSLQHVFCIRLCQGNFYVFDDDFVVLIPYDLIDIINNKLLFIRFIKSTDRYKDKNINPDDVIFHSYLFEKLTT